MRAVAVIAMALGLSGAAPPPGALTRQLDTPGIPGLAFVAPPDGRNLYAAGGIDSHSSRVAVLRRDPSTGRVSPVRRACSFHCSYADGLNNPSAIALTPDGNDVIVGNRSGSHPVSVYRRDRRGHLRMISCVGADFPKFRCARGDVGGFMGIAVSGDGRNVYFAHANGVRIVASFQRVKRTGRLTQPAGAAGCVVPAGSTYGGCAQAPSAKFRPHAATVSPDGRHVYVASITQDGARGIFAFQRDQATGALSPLPTPSACLLSVAGAGCETIAGLSGGEIVFSPDGRNAYVEGSMVFERDTSTGALTRVPRRGAAGALVFSPDGTVAYEGGATLRTYRRAANGGLTLLRSPYGIVRGGGTYAPVVTHDGRNVYASGRVFTTYRIAR